MGEHLHLRLAGVEVGEGDAGVGDVELLEGAQDLLPGPVLVLGPVAQDKVAGVALGVDQGAQDAVAGGFVERDGGEGVGGGGGRRRGARRCCCCCCCCCRRGG